MPAYKLVYFPARGRAEAARYLFAYGKTPYETKAVSMMEEWPKMKGEMPFGSIPALYVDGKMLVQSAAIWRYLAREFGVDGKTNWDKAQADMLFDGVQDAVSAAGGMGPAVMAKFTNDDAKFKTAWETYKQGSILPFLKRYTGFLKANASGRGQFFVGDYLTWADIVIAEFVDRMDVCFEPGILAGFPELKAHRDKVHALPGIAEHVATRPKTLA